MQNKIKKLQNIQHSIGVTLHGIATELKYAAGFAIICSHSPITTMFFFSTHAAKKIVNHSIILKGETRLITNPEGNREKEKVVLF